MTQLDIQTKIAMMIDSMLTAKKMLQDDNIRPALKARLEEDIARMHKDLRELYIDLFKIMSN